MDSAKAENEEFHSPPTSGPLKSSKLSRVDLILRILLFVNTLVAIIVMVTSKQKKEILPHLFVVAKFNHSPAFVYFVVAISVACLYSLLTAVRSAIRPHSESRTLFCIFFFDALIFGVVASALGAGASIGYVGEMGNSHVGWMKICNLFDEFCRHIGASIILSLSASFTLVFLLITSTYSLYRHSH